MRYTVLEAHAYDMKYFLFYDFTITLVQQNIYECSVVSVPEQIWVCHAYIQGDGVILGINVAAA